MTFPQNMGKMDRAARLVLGVALLFWGLAKGSWVALIGVVLLGTAYFSSCLIYKYAKIDTRSDEEKKA